MGILFVQPSWISGVMDAQIADSWIQTNKGKIIRDPDSNWILGINGGLRMKGRLVVADIPQLKELFDESHHTRYTVHPGTTKMCKDLKGTFGGRIYGRMW